MNAFMLVVVYLLMDLVWLYSMNSILYQEAFSRIQNKPMELNRIYGFLAYIVLVFALLQICIPLSNTYSRYRWSAFTLVGFCIYSIFNFTNAAVFEKYSSQLVVVDTLWGTCCFSVLGLLYHSK